MGNYDEELRNQAATLENRNNYDTHLNMTADMFNMMHEQLQDDLQPFDML